MSNISPLSARIRFNPRTRGGCDPLFLYSMSGTRSFQSTHPWGVRPFVLCKDFNVKQFQSTHPWGCDLIATSGTDEVTLFQSTHPWGVRRLRGRPASERSARFNPRTHGGCDHGSIISDPRRNPVSIHAPVKGAILRALQGLQHQAVSIHAPEWGAT